ncbi:hypothetical protein [Nitrososphaera viennensis]|uniref:Uncharacterized protein n=2 Tax=Nitrososphaera viennensis TaxID=1034015 RepID=A0A060HNB4_9ARCH|nr:hypothetical protein [Nitrososphaera viennensis]AIC16943.1 hypothetical protein NVIE_026730 [Nitrososphaera viennensis EN76]UVS68846.1 hypothetical protein NWT39_13175 [Nitrososphaera viennensis]CBX88953.1 hypothetical protein [Nitrososphaera phage Pro-Nvie1]
MADLKSIFDKYIREGESGRSNTNELLKAIVDEIEALKSKRR